MTPQNRRCTLWLLTILGATGLVAVFHRHVGVHVLLPEYLKCPVQFRQNFSRGMNEYRQCLLQKLQPQKDVFNFLQVAVDQCSDKKLWASFDIKTFRNKDESKFLILAKPNQSCVEVTLGVGQDIRAEQQIRAAVPQCRFFGADPILASGQVFQQIGQYFEVAVGADAGVQAQHVLEGNVYREKKVITVNFVDFLNQYVGTTFVDFMLMDNEGPEYEIFPKYLIDSPSPVRICQLNTEMHGPLHNYRMTPIKFHELIVAILTRSQFVPLHSEMGHGHVRTFYVNTEDRDCTDKYFLYKYCDTNVVGSWKILD